MAENTPNYSKENIDIEPSFDFFSLLELLEEKRLGGEVLDELGDAWDRWLDKLHVYRLKVGKIGYLVTWLDESVEEEIDTKWSESPEDSFRFNCLAQNLIMTAVQTVLPEVLDAGCAPAPKPTDSLIDALEDMQIPYNDDVTALTRRFATLTHFPFRGACEICYLQENCPKAQANAQSFHSVELKGYE